MILRYTGVRRIRGRYFSEFYDAAQTIAFVLRKNILPLLKGVEGKIKSAVDFKNVFKIDRTSC